MPGPVNQIGKLPVWLSPIQTIIMGITDRNSEACNKIYQRLSAKGYRVELDIRNEKVGFKIREHTLQRIPFLLIIGDKEENNNQVSVRTREGKDLGVMNLDEFLEILNQSISLKGRVMN